MLNFITDEWVTQQRLVQLQLLAKCLTGEEIARELISVLQVGYRSAIIGYMHDRASTNNVAMTTVKVLYSEILDVGCFSHTINHVREKFCTPTLIEFVIAWINLFSCSPKACLAWQICTGSTTKSYSQTKWWSRHEVIAQL